MAREIRLTWNGHSCFTVEAEGYRIVFDPYSDGAVPGYAPVRLTANEVICSHEHRDHAFRDGVKIVSGGESPFKREGFTVPHDDKQGSLRGMNEVTVLSACGMRVAHFGDIGCDPTPEQEELLRNLDLVMIPVGGYYTMEPDGIERLLSRIQPKVVIPMHYRMPELGYDVLHVLGDFLDQRHDVKRYDTNQFILTPDTQAQTAVLTYIRPEA